MANNQNLKPFGKDNPPPAKGRKIGAQNRSVVIRKWLEAEMITENPVNGKTQKLSVLDIIIHAQIMKAKQGDTAAFTALMDGCFGKIPQTLQQEITNIQLQPPTIIQIEYHGD